ncbi:MAG: thioredoxin-disulfide reductase [Spirochaetes bacterium]|nr:MAG: thioredoxin-disulfide reductase [Spirochaetota bacterium]
MKIKDLIIAGAGPAGLSAAIYGMRAGMDLVVVEKIAPGGQVMTTYEVENYPGFAEPVPGWELMSRMEAQARRLGADIASGDIERFSWNAEEKCFVMNIAGGETLRARAVIAATGASLMKLGVPGEAEFTGRGVSYCATCDAAFFRDRVTAVVGGGNTALEEANYLTKFSSKVYLIHRRDKFRGEKMLQERVLANPKIEPVYHAVITAVIGEHKVESVGISDCLTGESRALPVDGVFIFVGYQPNTAWLPADLLSKKGEVIVDMQMRTSLPGLFAAGDLRLDSIRQIVAATADGATAALSAYQYLEGL